MHLWRRRHRGVTTAMAIVITAVTLAGLAQAAAQPRETITREGTSCTGEHWVAAWTAPPQSSSLGRSDDTALGLADGPARTFADQTLRMFVAPHVAGGGLRVHLSNRFGTGPVTFTAASIGLRASGSSLEPGTVQSLAFGGQRDVTVPAGEEVVSDPVFVDVRPFEPFGVSVHVAGPAALDYHQWALATTYATPAGSGDHAVDPDGAAFTEELTSSFAVTAVDVLAPRKVAAVVAIGDSITDGIGSSPDSNQRWTDQLARRALGSSTPLSIVNAGIGGNRVAPSAVGIGPAAPARFKLDALQQQGVTDVFVFEGINDIATSAPGSDVADRVIAGYRSIITAARAEGVRVVASTITPAGLTGEKEAARRAVNHWIRTSGAFDAVVDFDRVVRDPRHHSSVLPEYDAAMAHLTDAGYLALAKSVDLDLFQGAGCGS